MFECHFTSYDNSVLALEFSPGKFNGKITVSFDVAHD